MNNYLKLIPSKDPVPKFEGGFIDSEGIRLKLPLTAYYQRRVKSGELIELVAVQKNNDKKIKQQSKE